MRVSRCTDTISPGEVVIELASSSKHPDQMIKIWVFETFSCIVNMISHRKIMDKIFNHVLRIFKT